MIISITITVCTVFMLSNTSAELLMQVIGISNEYKNEQFFSKGSKIMHLKALGTFL